MLKKSYIVLILVILIAISIVNFIFGLFSNSGREEVEIVNQQFENIEIDTENTNINLMVAEDEAFVELLNKGDYVLKVNTEGKTLDIEVDHKWWFNWFSFDIFFHTPTLNVHLPKEVYEKVIMETKNGKVTASDLEVTEINTKTNNGAIVIKDIISNYVYAESDNGDVILENIDGRIIGETNNGSVKVATETLEKPIQLETDNGNINIDVKEDPKNVTFEIKTDNGDIRVFNTENYDTVIGNGENLIQLTSNNGNISIEKQ